MSVMPKQRNVTRKFPKPKFHILCEGEKTEPNYLDYYLSLFHGNWANRILIKVEEVEENEPISLIKRAIQIKKEARHKEDVFWCVYDRESPTKYEDSRHMKAYEYARKNEINIALSNVCFEVWVLLHRQNYCGAYSNYDDLRKRSNLKTLFKGYDKNYQFDFTQKEIHFARENAKRMNAQTLSGASRGRELSHQLNPYTDVYRLLDAIDAFIDANS